MGVMDTVFFNSEIFLTVLVDDHANGFVALVTDEVSGSETDFGGETFGELVNEVLSWAGVGGLTFDVNESIDHIRDALDLVRDTVHASQGERAFQVKIYTSF